MKLNASPNLSYRFLQRVTKLYFEHERIKKGNIHLIVKIWLIGKIIIEKRLSKGWKSALKPLRETFDHNDYVFNLTMLEKGILEFLLLH